MSSYILKTVVGNEFDNVVKELGFGKDTSADDDDDSGGGMSATEIIAEQKKQKAAEEERRARHAKVEKEREEARQKIRDKYNIKKKDEPAATAGRKGAHEALRSPAPPPSASRPPPVAENHGFDPVKMTTNAFSSLKAKFGWK